MPSFLGSLLRNVRVPRRQSDLESLGTSTTLTINTSGSTFDSSDYGTWTDSSLVETPSSKDNTLDVRNYDYTKPVYKEALKPNRVIDLEEARRIIKPRRVPPPLMKKNESFVEKLLNCLCCCCNSSTEEEPLIQDRETVGS